MFGLLQRVTQASVSVDDKVFGVIGPGLLVLVGIEREDTGVSADRLLERLLGYRVFTDVTGRMNASLRDFCDGNGGLLLVPQFTLAADTSSGTRASFDTAMEPGRARALFAVLLDRARKRWPHTESGRFGVDMQVSLVNDGPVTFLLRA